MLYYNQNNPEKIKLKFMRKQTKQNSCLNGEWAQHVRRWLKKYTNGQRRANSKEVIRKDLQETN